MCAVFHLGGRGAGGGGAVLGLRRGTGSLRGYEAPMALNRTKIMTLKMLYPILGPGVVS